MPVKRNPLNLNSLQLKTLTLLQELAQFGGKPAPEDEPAGLAIAELPNPHGDHFHLGEAVVAARDAAGDQQALDPGAHGPGDVGAQAVVDRQDAVAVGDPEQAEAAVIE